MNKTFYRQLDSRWRYLPFPGKGDNIGGNGCGCCSITHVIIELDRYKRYTPADVRPSMVRYATRDGLLHAGIDAALKFYGLDYIHVGTKDPMSKAWKYLGHDGYHAGVLLFYSGKGPDGTQWTSCGHFVAFVGYKIVNGKHWFFLKDSGDRVSTHVNIKGKKIKVRHNGWWCYEDSMKGCLPKLWIAKIPEGKVPKKVDNTPKKETPKVEAKSSTGYSGTLPSFPVKVKEPKGKLIANLATEYAYAGEPKSAAWPKGKPKDAYKKALNKAYPDRKGWGASPKAGASCDVFVGTVVRMAGIDKDFPRGLDQQQPRLAKSSAFDCVISTTKGNVKMGDLKDGDIITYRYNGGAGHIMIFADSKAKHASHDKWYGRTTSISSRLKISGRKWIKVYRAVGTYEATRSYIKKGDKIDAVKQWQNYLNWYFGKNVLVADGIFGDQTDKYSKEFQKAMGLDPDGFVGPVTIDKAKGVKK